MNINYHENHTGRRLDNASLDTITNKINALNEESNLYLHIHSGVWHISIIGGHIERVEVIIQELNSPNRSIRLVDKEQTMENEGRTILMKMDNGTIDEVELHNTVSKQLAINFVIDFVKLNKPSESYTYK